MNIREVLGTASLALGTIMLFRLFWGGWNAPENNARFVAPVSQMAQTPLRLEVDFVDQEQEVKQQNVQVQTDYAAMTFSNFGATITDVTFTRDLNNKKQTFKVWSSDDAIDREQLPFLVALDSQTPYAYTLVKQEENDDQAVLVYEAKSAQATIRKQFTVFKKVHKTDLAITLVPSQPMHARLLWPSPILKELGDEDPVSATVIGRNNKFQLISLDKVKANEGFFAPTLFGSSDKYFAFSMVKDSHSFAERAYFKTVGQRLISFLESKEVSEETTWNLSFYLGPKEAESMLPVDTRLEKILNYGMFSFIAKPLLAVIKLFEGYTHNYGLAIILVTLLLKLFLLPFTLRGDKNMKKFQANQQKLEYITQKYKNDPEALEAARLEHIKKHGTGGLLGGCLPMLVQVPFFMGLYSGLNNSIELYRAPFIGWIKDLSLPDPYYVLPLIIFLALVTNAFMGPGKKDIKTLMVPLVIALVFGSATTTMASGLCLYLASNMLLHGLQSRLQKAF